MVKVCAPKSQNASPFIAGFDGTSAPSAYIRYMPRKPIELPPGVARSFVRDMHAFLAEKNAIKRDEDRGAPAARAQAALHGQAPALRRERGVSADAGQSGLSKPQRRQPNHNKAAMQRAAQTATPPIIANVSSSSNVS
jgi:hypothetical protein